MSSSGTLSKNNTPQILPVFHIRQSSMTPTLQNGETLVFVATTDINTGDIVAFRHDESTLIKRVIAGPGDLLDINASGAVSVNGVVLDEPYVDSQSLGQCDIALPFRVAEGEYFVMGDNRAESLDSRYTGIGTVSKDQIEGMAFLRIWPLDRIKLF